MTSKTKGTFFALICVALWALIPVVAKLGQQNLDNHQFLFWSSLVSFLVLFISALRSGQAVQFRQFTFSVWIKLLALGLLGTYIYYLFLYLGYAKAEGIQVFVFQYSWPILIVLFSIPILKEKLTGKKIISILLGFAGVLVVITKGEFAGIQLSNPIVNLLVLTGAACFALFSVLSKNVNKAPLAVVSVYFFSACIASLFSMFYFSSFALPTVQEIFPILLNGILVNGFSYVFWQMALKSAPASFLAPFVYISPALSAVYLFVIFNF